MESRLTSLKSVLGISIRRFAELSNHDSCPYPDEKQKGDPLINPDKRSPRQHGLFVRDFGEACPPFGPVALFSAPTGIFQLNQPCAGASFG